MRRSKTVGSITKKAAETSLKSKIIISLVLVAIAAGIIQQTIFTGNTDTLINKNQGIKAIPEGSIELYTVYKKEINDSIDILGQIVFREKVNISSKVSGRLMKIHVQEGKIVRKGQLIAEVERLPLEIQLSQQKSELDITNRAYDLTRAKYENALKATEIKLKTIGKAQADLNDKTVTYKNMDRILKNKKILFEAGGISETEMRSIQTQHTTLLTKYKLAQSDLEIQMVGYRDEDIKSEGLAVPKSKKKRIELLKRINTKIERAELESAKARIAQVKNNIRSTNLMLSETYLRSPIYGVIASKNMEAGEMLKNDSVVATVIKISQVYVAFNVNEKEITRIKKGQRVAFTVDALGDKKYSGRITRITPVLDMKTRTVEVKAIVNNPGGKLLPGMFARANIQISKQGKKLTIPNSALMNKDKNQAQVYLTKKGIVFKQNVLLGQEFSEDVEIKKGLRVKDIIISKGVQVAYPGMTLPASLTKSKK